MKGYPIPPNLHKLKLHQKLKIASLIFWHTREPMPYPLKIGLTHSMLSFCALPSLAQARPDLAMIVVFWAGALAASITINEVIRVISR